MFSKLTKKFFFTLTTFTLVFSAGSIVQADDTEIYFTGGGLDEAVRPNVLFILDTSGSMTSIVSNSGNKQRIEVMKDAVKQVIEDVEDINIGLMRFTSGSGGPVLFPITYVEENVFNVVGETASATTIDYESSITNGANDAKEILATTEPSITVGTVTTSDAEIQVTRVATGGGGGITNNFEFTLQANDDDAEQNLGTYGTGMIMDGGCPGCPAGLMAMFVSWNGDFERFQGLRFTGMDIPQGATIDHAYLDFTIMQKKNDNTDVRIYAEDIDDATQYVNSNNDMLSRTLTDGTGVPGNGRVNWNGIDAADVDTVITSPDLKNVVQEIVNRPGWNGGGPGTAGIINFIIDTVKGDRRYYSRNANPAKAAKLRIETTSVAGAGASTTDQLMALRFENIRIPQGATLTSASLVFTGSGDDENDAGDISIWGELVDDSAEFSLTPSGLSGRADTTAKFVWKAPNIDAGDSVETSNTAGSTGSLTAVMNEIVGQAGWCGGNAMTFFIQNEALNGYKRFFTHEGSSANAPKLKYSYTATNGCMTTTETAQVSIGNDDAEQYGTTTNTIDTDIDIGYDSDLGSDQTVGIRFQGIDVPNGATITEAFIEFYSHDSPSTGTASFTIKGIDEDSPSTFAATTDDISSRNTTTAEVTWEPEEWTSPSSLYSSNDIKTIVQEIVDRAGWSSGNEMGFVIEPGTGTRIAKSFNADPARGPRLRIKYSDTVSVPFKSVRESLIEIIDDLPASGSTPIQETMYEAARYWRGESMEYGDTRSGSKSARISHPGSYCTSPGNCRGAKENSANTDQYGVNTPSNCNMASNPNSNSCANQIIEHDNNSVEAKYISPFSSDLTCANNYQVLLTDGSANSGNDESPEIVAMIPKSSCYNNNSSFKTSEDNSITYSQDEDCTVDLAEYLATTDQSTSSIGENLANDQIVKTYSIGFNLGSGDPTQFIKDIANVGQGEYYEANTAGQLVDVFTTILTDVKSDPTSFVSPSLATNAFNRLLSRDEVYFGLFTPQLSQSWLGNVKKYRICIDSGGVDGDISTTADNCTLGEILDTNNVSAIDTLDDKFKDTAQSVWSNAADGKATTQGGAGAEITDFTTQILYTDKNGSGQATSGAALSGSGFKMTSATWDDASLSALRSSVCPVPSTSGGSQCEDRMRWLLGKKIVTDSLNDISTSQRWSVNDVLHSSPSVITYGGSDLDADGVIDEFFDKVLYGTNDGMLHFVNGVTGAEEWRYLPSDFWSQQQTQYLNSQGDHIYGLDVTPTIWTVDNDLDGKIEPASPEFDTVKAFVATRRGGNYIYALDLTADVSTSATPVIPKFLWKIQGGTGSYTRLGQTWSQPQLTTISISDGSGGTTTKEVLIFGGGYDTGLDDPNVYEPADNSGNDFMGNAIYITDPNDGSLIMSISGAGSFANTPSASNIPVADMHYSIPSRVRLMDSDGDGDTDRLYVGDTGGQVWRVDLDPELAAGSPANTVVGKLADVSTATATTQRRFYEPPSVVQVRDTVYSDTTEYDYVLIGSGYRAHPLNSDVQDRFYAFRDRLIGTFSLPDADGDGVAEVADAYPQAASAYSDTDLIDVTASALDSTDASHLAADGWFYDFTTAGSAAEKVLSAPTTTSGIVVFTTFKPSTVSLADPCQGGVGDASAYNLDILSANAGLDWDGDGDIDLADRVLALGGGIPSDVVPVFTEEGVVGIVGIEGGASQLGVLSGLPRYRTYWYEDS